MDIKPSLSITKPQLVILKDFLVSEAVPEDCMTLNQLDGFLTVLICGPVALMPSEYLPIVWGGEEEPVFESEEHANEITELITALQNKIATSFHGNEEFTPLFHRFKNDEGKELVEARS